MHDKTNTKTKKEESHGYQKGKYLNDSLWSNKMLIDGFNCINPKRNVSLKVVLPNDSCFALDHIFADT